MKYIFLIFLIFLLTSCGKPKAVLICGDHVCLNKAEAELYFEENLTLEVKIIDKKVNKNIDLIELNLKNDAKGSREVLISSKKKTNKNLKVLSKEEIVKIKKNIKNKEKKKRIKKVIKEKKESNKMNTEKIVKIKKNMSKDKKTIQINANNINKNVVDVCTILEKCSIDEISKYLLEQGKKKKFPDITTRQ